MTELETMQRAKMYLDKLANGVDPLTDTPVPDGDCINQVRISRCLFYVSDILRKLIESGGRIDKPSKIKKAAFAIGPEELNGFVLDEKPIPVSEIADKINSLIDLQRMTKLKYSSITSFLIQGGFLVEHESENGRKSKIPTDHGIAIGITQELCQGKNGPYHVTVYNSRAQQFILDHIDAIAEINEPVPVSEFSTLRGKPWTENYDEALADLYSKQVPISEIAVTLKRSENAIRMRIQKLGLTQ